MATPSTATDGTPSEAGTVTNRGGEATTSEPAPKTADDASSLHTKHGVWPPQGKIMDDQRIDDSKAYGIWPALFGLAFAILITWLMFHLATGFL